MSTPVWICLYIFISLTCKWILSWGGAEVIKGWKSIFFLDMEADWNKEQLRAMALFTWIGFTILFIVGLIFFFFWFYKLYS